MQFVSDDDEAKIEADTDAKIVFRTTVDCEVQYGLKLLRAYSSDLEKSSEKYYDEHEDIMNQDVSQLGWDIEDNEIFGPAKITGDPGELYLDVF